MKKVICFILVLACLYCAKQKGDARGNPPNWETLVLEFESFVEEGAPHSKEWGKLSEKFVKLAKKGHAETFQYLFQYATEADGGFALDLGELYSEIYHLQPELFKKILAEEPKKVQDAVDFLMATSSGIPGD